MNIYGFTREKLIQYLSKINEKSFRATQIFEWLYRKHVDNFSDMNNISKNSITALENYFEVNKLSLETEQISADGTRKYLFKLADGNFIETVLMKYLYGNSVCVSTQVGCNMGCEFCASGINKRVRNLEVEEIVLQVVMIDNILHQVGERVSHVVVMGIGEPFDNYDNLIDFLEIINDPKGLEIGSRHITVSTCGIIPKIYQYSEFALQVNLAISLHFPNDYLRNKYMPISKAYPLSDLIKALEFYYQKTKRRITFEYILLKDINDDQKNCYQLLDLIKGMNCYVNLIPLNESNNRFQRSSKKTMDLFYQTLAKNDINVTLRREQGHDIDAACGQLRIKRERDECKD